MYIWKATRWCLFLLLLLYFYYFSYEAFRKWRIRLHFVEGSKIHSVCLHCVTQYVFIPFEGHQDSVHKEILRLEGLFVFL